MEECCKTVIGIKMRLTSEREKQIRLGHTDDYLDQINDLLSEIDALRNDLKYENNLVKENEDFCIFLGKEIDRLKEYEWMYKDLE